MHPSRALALSAALGVAGCAQTVVVKVPDAHTKVVVDGEDIGAVPEAGKAVEVRPGLGAMPYSVTTTEGGKPVERIGSVARTEPVWWMIAAGAAGAVCCAPTLAGAGFCIANPGVLGAPLAFALTGDVGALTASFVAPSWFTLPVVTACGAAGLAPLSLALVAETVPPEVTLVVPPAAPALSGGAPGPQPGRGAPRTPGAEKAMAH